MSKSIGNFIIIRDANKEFGADASRFSVLSGGEGLDDPNFDTEMAKSMTPKIEVLLDFAKQYYGKGREHKLKIDEWLEQKIDLIIHKTTSAYEELLFRSALQSCYFEMQNALKWYMRRTVNTPNKDTINRFIEVETLLMSPITPFICEEIWQSIGKEGFITKAHWPKQKHLIEKMSRSEDIIQQTMEDINSVLRLLKIEKPSKIMLFVSEPWKYEFYSLLKEEIAVSRDFGKIMGTVMKHEEFKKHSNDISKIIQKALKSGIDENFDRKEELHSLKESIDFLSKEFNAEIEVIEAEKSSEQIAKNAIPNKPAILIE
jgi:leucyl-tRNA synthetase